KLLAYIAAIEELRRIGIANARVVAAGVLPLVPSPSPGGPVCLPAEVAPLPRKPRRAQKPRETPEQRSERCRRAANQRWANARKMREQCGQMHLALDVTNVDAHASGMHRGACADASEAARSIASPARAHASSTSVCLSVCSPSFIYKNREGQTDKQAEPTGEEAKHAECKLILAEIEACFGPSSMAFAAKLGRAARAGKPDATEEEI